MTRQLGHPLPAPLSGRAPALTWRGAVALFVAAVVVVALLLTPVAVWRIAKSEPRWAAKETR